MKFRIDANGIALLDKGKKGFFRAVFSRLGLIVLLLGLQVAVLFSMFQWFGAFIPHIVGVSVAFIVGMVLYLLNSRLDPTAKITWLVVIMLMPVFGALLFFYTQSDLGHRMIKGRLAQLARQTWDAVPQPPGVREALERENPGAASLARYIRRSGCFPVFGRTGVTYFPSGERMWEALLAKLEKAESFIFLEFFIINEGLMWGKILEVLARKAAAGVDVRVMYDGTCEFSTLPCDYPKRLGRLGIQCKVFSPLTPFLSTHYNYRDHRKILVIDGKTAFNGGVNLADEYINHIERFGHWKDAAVMLKGEAVRSFTRMFLEMWAIDEKEPEFDRFILPPAPPQEGKGFVIPYADCPLDGERVGERVYMDLLNRACRYVHIMTPYLILDGEMETALKFAAERGVEVSLILPGIPDKPVPYALARTHYCSLLDSGVRIYEYAPGFVHSKLFVADGREAVVGTINLDYRSLYHHFECATYMCGADCIADIEADFQGTLKACRPGTKETVRDEKWTQKLTGILLKAVATLL